MRCPFDTAIELGELVYAGPAECEAALERAHEAFDGWRRAPVEVRATCLDCVADLLEEERFRFMALAVYEAGKTLSAALGEVREASAVQGEALVDLERDPVLQAALEVLVNGEAASN